MNYKTGRTPLHFACADVHEEMTRTLVLAGADTTLRDQVCILVS